MFKDERYISNNVTNGAIMFELDNEYIVDIYVAVKRIKKYKCKKLYKINKKLVLYNFFSQKK